MAAELATRHATELAGLVRARKASPVEVTEAVLARIDACEPALNAFVVLDREGAIEAAKAAEAAVAGGAALGPLHGVPVTIKDVQAVAGLPTRRGSRLSDPAPATADAPLVARLRAAGAIILGKTTATELGWTAVSDSPLTGSTHNPWRRGYTSGGSSCGAAALAAAGCGPLHLGTDGAGSIRLPAHFCGAIGLKPTFGTVPYGPTPNNNLLSHAGPITRSVADAELMMEVMSGWHPLDPLSHPGGYRADTGSAGVKGLRIAYSPDLGHARVDSDVAAIVADAVGELARLGAVVKEVTPPWGPQGSHLVRKLWVPPLLYYKPDDEKAAAAIDAGLLACLRSYADTPWIDISNAHAERLAYAAAVGQWFADGWDLLVTPSASVAAFPHGRQRPDHWPHHPWDWLVWAEFSYPFDLSHSPAVSVPCGLTPEGLPVGLQIVGTRFADPLVMRAARAFLEARPFAYSCMEVGAH
ncbi:MAG: amidase family protein [Hyphomicrobiaceae bacterium]|nr:amidase family protein [Hyphomicrobiaceae bacterium]